MMDQISLSVLLSTYKRDDPKDLDDAINSVVCQTHPPDEIIIVCDGPIAEELKSIINSWKENGRVPVINIQLSENVGLGGALKEGMKHVNSEFVARMDSDDISVTDRFEQQTEYLKDHPDVDILGGYIAEFSGTQENILATREVPTEHEEIMEMARFRSPFNHATIVMRTSAVLSAGNYRAVNRMEDWDLWSRMLLDGARAANLPQVLLYVRAGDEMYGRRGGVEYMLSEFARQREFLRRGFVTPGQFTRNIITRPPVRILPKRIRQILYERYLRN